MGSFGWAIKNTGEKFLEHCRLNRKSGHSDNARATSLLSTFGAARLNDIADVTSDEAL